MSDETVTWTEADKAELLDAVIKAACTCDYDLCGLCDAMVYGGDQVHEIVGVRDNNVKYWRERALAAEAQVRELTPPATDGYSVPFFGDYPSDDDAVVIAGGRPITREIIEHAHDVILKASSSCPGCGSTSSEHPYWCATRHV